MLVKGGRERVEGDVGGVGIGIRCWGFFREIGEYVLGCREKW